MGGIINSVNPGAGGSVAEPLKKSIQLLPGTLGPDFDIPVRGVADPARYMQEAGLVDAGIPKADSLDAAPDTGKKRLRGGGTGGFHRSPSSRKRSKTSGEKPS